MSLDFKRHRCFLQLFHCSIKLVGDRRVINVYFTNSVLHLGQHLCQVVQDLLLPLKNLKSLGRVSNMPRALRIDHIQISVRTTTSGHVAAAPVSKLCGLTSNCTRCCRRGTVGRCTDFTKIMSVCLHQTMPSIFVLSISNCEAAVIMVAILRVHG